MKRRIESTTSRTAEMTCMSRASSALETNSHYKSGDHIAPLLLPGFLKPLLHLSPIRKLFSRVLAPQGIYEYVIARTKYIDAVFERMPTEPFDQILILGAGFDTRALRFQENLQNTRVFELDIVMTQQAKIGQYQKRHLAVPANVTFIAIDFDKETLPVKLDEAGFRMGERSLFIMEGLLMYLQSVSVRTTFQTIQAYAGKGSRVIFDYIHAAVLRNEGVYYGETGIAKTVSGAGEQWQFGIEKGEIGTFLAAYSLKLIDHKDAEELEKIYFSDADGKTMGRVNGTHCLVTAEKT
ncbi:MAG: SAM-dependent methyltransferase [Deltaproteobacteria bacterium]|nr:SAM-dependent methyltransferase [Deltaproteobacteria bacterium]